MSCAHAFGEWCPECLDGLVQQYNALRHELTALTRARDAAQQELGERAVAYMRDSMAMPNSESDQEQNWILGHLVTFAHLVTGAERAKRIVAQRGRALELMSRGSAAVELENNLREQLALAELRAEAAEQQLAALGVCRSCEGRGTVIGHESADYGGPHYRADVPCLDCRGTGRRAEGLEQQLAAAQQEHKDCVKQTTHAFAVRRAEAAEQEFAEAIADRNLAQQAAAEWRDKLAATMVQLADRTRERDAYWEQLTEIDVQTGKGVVAKAWRLKDDVVSAATFMEVAERLEEALAAVSPIPRVTPPRQKEEKKEDTR